MAGLVVLVLVTLFTSSGFAIDPTVSHKHELEFLNEQRRLRGRAAGRPPRRLAAATAGGATTHRRLRVRLEISGLFQETAAPHTACFRVGDFYVRGIQSPGAHETYPWCQLDDVTGCRARCTEDDIVEPVGRSRFIAMVEAVLSDSFGFLSVPVTEQPLVLTRSVGTHSAHYRHRGIPEQAQCARDCRLLGHWLVPDAMCTMGANASDLILVLLKLPGIRGVAASAGPCHFAANGRPNVAMVNWYQALDSQRSVAEQVERDRSLVLHEIFHATGFLWSEFYSAGLLERRAFVDVDGSTDTPWTFRLGTNVASAASAHFGCPNARMPLMVYPELGFGLPRPPSRAPPNPLRAPHRLVP
jgi:hypothetical protein